MKKLVGCLSDRSITKDKMTTKFPNIVTMLVKPASVPNKPICQTGRRSTAVTLFVLLTQVILLSLKASIWVSNERQDWKVIDDEEDDEMDVCCGAEMLTKRATSVTDDMADAAAAATAVASSAGLTTNVTVYLSLFY